MNTNIDIRSMTSEEFLQYLQVMIDEFRRVVAEDIDYQFARDGERMGLGDWFEQFACHSGLI